MIKSLQSFILKNLYQKKKIYIIPSRDGFIFLFVNFVLFLIGLTYANNLTLLISFILFIFFIFIMFHTHQDLEHHKSIKLLARDNYEGVFTVKADQSFNNTRLEYLFNKKSFTSSIANNIATFETLPKGHYSNSQFKISTFGNFSLFYVWSYILQDESFYVYPKRLKTDELGINNTILASQHASEEFSHHTRYQVGMNSKRINWKLYAKSNLLYAKEFTQPQANGLSINYQELVGSHDERIEKISFLISELTKKNIPFSLKLPQKFFPKSKGLEHSKRCLEFISVT